MHYRKLSIKVWCPGPLHWSKGRNTALLSCAIVSWSSTRPSCGSHGKLHFRNYRWDVASIGAAHGVLKCSLSLSTWPLILLQHHFSGLAQDAHVQILPDCPMISKIWNSGPCAHLSIHAYIAYHKEKCLDTEVLCSCSLSDTVRPLRK